MSGTGSQNVRDATLTMRPQLPARIDGMHALHRRNADSRFTAITRRNSSSVSSSHLITGYVPTLFTRTAGAPDVEQIDATHSSTARGSVTSAANPAAVPPAAAM